jgi:hypothetical protein
LGNGIALTPAQGWTRASSSTPVELNHSNPGAGFLIQVIQTSATSASALGQQFLTSDVGQAVTNLQVTDQGSKNLNWTTFTQVAVYTISGSVTSAQTSQPIFGQVFALVNPQKQIGAEIYSASDTSSDYSSVNQSVLDMVNSLQD